MRTQTTCAVLKKALNRLGYYQPYEKVGITDIADAALFKALKVFQKDQGLTPSGAIKPGDDTEQALARESAKTPSGYYIWRTVEDGKVRGAHAALNRTVREWDDSPDPGEDFNCRCWAEPVEITDAINSTIGPFDLLAAGMIARSALPLTAEALAIASQRALAGFRDTKWIANTPRAQLQSKFKHARNFGIKNNPNNHTLNQYKKALKDHVKNLETRVIKGTYHKEPVTHYFKPKTRINVIKKANGNFESVWRLTDKQIFHMLKNGKLGGNK